MSRPNYRTVIHDRIQQRLRAVPSDALLRTCEKCAGRFDARFFTSCPMCRAATFDPALVTHSFRRDRGHNWSMTVYYDRRDMTSVGFDWNRPDAARAQAIAVDAARRIAEREAK